MLPIGYHVTILRKKKGMTQARLAQQSGIPQPNLSRIETGEQDPTVSTLLRICQALNVPAAEFFKGFEMLPVRFTRTSVERMARRIAGVPVQLSREEKKIADLAQDLIPAQRGRAPSAKRVYAAWHELKSKLSEEEIKTLFERIQDARARREEIH